MIYLFFGQASFCRKKPFFEHTKIWWRVMIYLSQNMVESYDLPIPKNLQKNSFFFFFAKHGGEL